jgi:hypothetical protein
VCKDMDTLYNFFVSKSKAKEKGEEYKTTLWERANSLGNTSGLNPTWNWKTHTHTHTHTNSINTNIINHRIGSSKIFTLYMYMHASPKFLCVIYWHWQPYNTRTMTWIGLFALIEQTSYMHCMYKQIWLQYFRAAVKWYAFIWVDKHKIIFTKDTRAMSMST